MPLTAIADNSEDYAECFYSEQFQTLPDGAKQIGQEMRKDKILSRVFASALNGNWVVSDDLKPFFEKRNEFWICQGCLVWGPRVVIPKVLRRTLLNELDEGHLRNVTMKSVARSYVW